MADLQPTYYALKADVKEGGIGMGDIHIALYNLYKAVYAICNNLDEDASVLGTDYLSYIGTELATAMAKLKTPVSAKAV